MKKIAKTSSEKVMTKSQAKAKARKYNLDLSPGEFSWKEVFSTARKQWELRQVDNEGNLI